MPDWPQTMQPVHSDRHGDALVLDPTRPPGEVFQLTASTAEELVAWLTAAGLPPLATYMVNGGPVVVLADGGGAVGIGDYAVIADGEALAYPAGGFYQHYQQNPAVEAPEED